MGMFDWLQCDYILPAAEHQQLMFQTKSLGNLMDTFHIRSDGSLWGEHYDLEDHSDPNAVGLKRLAGMLSRVNVLPVFRADVSGDVCFYADAGRALGRPVEWAEYTATFRQGCLVGLRIGGR